MKRRPFLAAAGALLAADARAQAPAAKPVPAAVPAPGTPAKRPIFVLNSLDATISQIDLGSGEGKPVMIAGSPHYGFAFREVYGVDYSEDKIKAARKNVEAFNETASPDDAIDPDRVKFEWSSAADWHRGYGGVNVIYTYNSFGPNIMAEVEYRMRRNGGASVFIYDKPLHRQIFEDNGWEQRHEIVHRSDEDKRVAIYSFGLDR